MNRVVSIESLCHPRLRCGAGCADLFTRAGARAFVNFGQRRRRRLCRKPGGPGGEACHQRGERGPDYEEPDAPCDSAHASRSPFAAQLTVTVMDVDRSLPALSRAVAVSVCWVLVALLVFQAHWNVGPEPLVGVCRAPSR